MALRNYVYPQNGPMPLKKRLANSISKIKGCWVWQGRQYPNGYGLMTIKNKSFLPHRVSYETFKSKIPKGMEIDHLCRNRMCINPDHLETVTRRENQLRGNSVSGINARKVKCAQRHPLIGSNIYSPPKRPNSRHCKLCQNVRNKVYIIKKRQELSWL